LLEALSWSHRRRRNRGLWGLAAVGVLGVGGATARTWSDAEQQRCSGAQQQLAGIWDGARRDEVETAMLGVGQPYAQDVWDRAAPKLDAYSSAWEAMYTEACEAATVRAEQSPEMMDRRMQCLHRVAGELRATVDTLADVDTTVLSNTHKLVTSLPSLSQCEGAQAMVTELAAPLPTEADAVRAARGQLSRAKTLRTAGRYEAAQEAIAAAAATLEGVGYGPVRTELTLERGLVLHRLGEYVESERALKAAMAHASQWQQHGLLTDAVKNLMHVVGYKQQRIEAAMLLVPLLKGLSCADPVREAAARNAFANVLLVQGKYAEAEAEQRVALALRERTLSADHPHIALSFNNLAILLARQGKFLEAEAMFRTALTRRRKALGAHHPDVASSRNNLALVLAEQSKFEAAEAEHRKALASRRNALGPNHPDVAWSHNNIGIMLGHQGRHAEAEAEFRMAWSLWETTKGSSGARVGTFRNNLGDALWGQGKDAEAEVEFRAARSLFEQTLGTAHPDWAMAGSNLATLLESRGRYEEAEREARAALSSYEQAGTLEGHAAALARNSLGLALQGQGRYEEGQAELETALTVLVEKLGAEHLDSITAHQRLGTTLWRRGKHEEAEAEYRTALTLREKVQGLDHPEVASTRTVLADVLLRLGRQAEALSLAEQAWARSQRDDIDASDRATTAFVLARILWSIEGAARDRRRAKELADTALRIYRADEEAEHDDEREVEQWLSTHAAKRARR
ncbi:MAG: tetratricopeptide repeat protein, partial [Deltaproteobacteria bacterium]|nr:tetratricopeptide repeat protein [Deltaproteobacteria bacterium]